MSSLSIVRMPKWGLSMEEGTVGEWVKRPGDIVAEGDELVEIETTKITNVVEATQAGTLVRIVAEPGTVLECGRPIAILSDGSASEAEIEAFVATLAASPAVIEEDMPGEELVLSTLDVAGRSIQVGRAGSGSPPVVLIHGFAGDLQNWALTMGPLARDRTAIALDLPGHGTSDQAVGDGSLAALSAAVAGVLDELKVEAAHVVGHSLGAAVAQRLSLDRPDLAASLVLICPAGLPGTEISREFLDGIVNAQRARDIKAALGPLVSDPGLIGQDMVERMQRYKRLDGVQAALATLRDRLLAGDDIAALNASLDRMPRTLVIASRGDRIVGAPDPSALPDAWTVAWIEGSGHMPHLERAADVDALLRRHLSA